MPLEFAVGLGYIISTPQRIVHYALLWYCLRRPVVLPEVSRSDNVFASLERRILDGKTGVQGEATSPLSVKTVTRYLLGVSLSKPTHVSNNDT